MTTEELDELKNLLDMVAESPTKEYAAPYIQTLTSKAAKIKGNLNGYTRGKLTETVNFAKKASGNVSNKDGFILSMNNSWTVFKGDVKNNRHLCSS